MYLSGGNIFVTAPFLTTAEASKERRWTTYKTRIPGVNCYRTNFAATPAIA